MVLNPDECHFLTKEKIFGITIDSNLNFKSHMKKIYDKVNQRLSAFARISKLTTPTQRKKLINSFMDMDVFFKGMV